jgi:proteasome lid subunit RPN8/RPN11
MNNDNLLKYVIEHAKNEYPKECCGYIAADKDGEFRYIPCKNIAEDPEKDFRIDPVDYMNVVFEYSSPTMLVHSHPDGEAKPSGNDVVGCNSNAIPWFILSYPDKDSCIVMPKNRNFLTERAYVYGIMDCFTLVRDFYKLYEISIPNYYREDDFWNHGYSQYLDLYENNNFEKVDGIENLKFGDLVLFNIRCELPNHAGIYIGEGTLMHQPQSRLSLTEEMGLIWQNTFFCILRYKGPGLDDNSKLTRALKG